MLLQEDSNTLIFEHIIFHQTEKRGIERERERERKKEKIKICKYLNERFQRAKDCLDNECCIARM